jgi:hypothetical protein
MVRKDKNERCYGLTSLPGNCGENERWRTMLQNQELTPRPNEHPFPGQKNVRVVPLALNAHLLESWACAAREQNMEIENTSIFIPDPLAVGGSRG